MTIPEHSKFELACGYVIGTVATGAVVLVIAGVAIWCFRVLVR